MKMFKILMALGTVAFVFEIINNVLVSTEDIVHHGGINEE